MSELPPVDQVRATTTIITPAGLYQVNKGNNGYKLILTSQDLEKKEHDALKKEYAVLVEKARTPGINVPVESELTSNHLNLLNQAVTSKQGHSFYIQVGR